VRKGNLAYGDFSEREAAPRGQEFREIELSTPDDLPLVDLIELYAGIEYALPSDQGLVVQFVSATSGFGSEQVALDMAWAGASVLGRRMLLLYCNKSRQRLGAPRGAQASAEPMIEPDAPENDIVKVSGQELYLAEWRSWHAKSGALVGADVIDGHLDELRAFFDMIVMIAPPADGDPLAMIMARHVDGNVIILEAEQTRRSAAIRLREILARSGSPIVGAVLNNRRNHVPRWLSRFL
jgi:Mrp family chromosome partitioning ATPase